MELKGKIILKAKNGKGFKIEGQDCWYNAEGTAIDELKAAPLNQELIIVYTVKNLNNVVSKINSDVKQETPKPSNPAKFNCTVCGAELKDGRFKKCYNCNMAAKKAKEETPETTQEQEPQQSKIVHETKEPESEFKCIECGKPLKNNRFKKCFVCNKKNPEKSQKSASYNNPERDAQIRRGNALNAAGAALSGNLQGSDIDVIKEALIYLAEAGLNWLEEKNK